MSDWFRICVCFPIKARLFDGSRIKEARPVCCRPWFRHILARASLLPLILCAYADRSYAETVIAEDALNARSRFVSCSLTRTRNMWLMNIIFVAVHLLGLRGACSTGVSKYHVESIAQSEICGTNWLCINNNLHQMMLHAVHSGWCIATPYMSMMNSSGLWNIE